MFEFALRSSLLKLSFSSHTCQPFWFPNLSIVHFSIGFLVFFLLICRSFLYIPDSNPLLTHISSCSVLAGPYIPQPELTLRESRQFTWWHPASHPLLNLSGFSHPPWSRNNESIPPFVSPFEKESGWDYLSSLSSKLPMLITIKCRIMAAYGRRTGVVIRAGTQRSFWRLAKIYFLTWVVLP